MKISIYSDKASEQRGIGWHKDCFNIKYFANGIRRGEEPTPFSPQFYSLTFTYTFAYDQDNVYFAYSVPYSYTDLRNDL
jgi:hypothetical protein